MAFSFAKLKNIMSVGREGQLAGSGSLEPEVGFKLSHSPLNKCLYVTVLGARHLPSFFGLTRAHGYLVKVKVFPGDSKYETTIQENSWPVWNEDFKFQLKQKDSKNAPKSDLQSQLAGHFLSLTIYAILENQKTEQEKRKSAKTLDSKKTAKVGDQEEKTKSGFFDKNLFGSFKSTKGESSPQKSLLEKRRTVGAATWNFDSKLFQNDLKNGLIGTPDIWRPINAITTGVAGTDPRRENKKGQLEVCIVYSASEDGLNDTVQATVQRLRCSVATMQEHEQFRAPLYLKAAILEAGKSESSWKSDRFMPSISARWDPNTSFVKLSVFKASLDKVSLYFSLGCKNKMGKKEILGKATVGASSAYADSWSECLRSPGISKTLWLNFE